MISYILVNQISAFLIIISGLWLAFWVYFADSKAKTNQAFFIFTFFLVLWTSFPFFFNLPSISHNLALLFVRLAYGVTALFLIPFYYFVIHFPYKADEKYRFLGKIIFIIAISLFVISSFTGFHVSNIEEKEWGVSPIFGQGKIVYFAFMLLLALSIIAILLRKYFILHKKEKIKIQYVLIGISLFIFLNSIFNVIFPLWLDNLKYYPLGNYSAIFLLGFIAYAIVKKKLFGIKIVLTALLVVSIALLLLVNYLISETIFEYIWKGLTFIIFLFFGWRLIKSTSTELAQKEEVDKLSTQVSVANLRLESSYKKLQKLDRAKSEFVSISSHQLRTPLTAIKGYISMILDGDYGSVSEKIQKALNNVYTSNERLIDLVNSLLNLSRIESGKIQLNKENFSIVETLESLVKEFSTRAKDRGLALEFLPPQPNFPEIKGDEQKLREALGNFIDNAIKYTEKGKITISLILKNPDVPLNQQRILITVQDTGAGLSKEEIDKLFKSFSRAEAGQRHWVQGTGLGLYIVKKFIEMHQGRVWVESEGKGQGSRFYIELPVR